MTTVRSRTSAIAPPHRAPETQDMPVSGASNLRINEKVKATFQIPRIDLEALQGFANADATSVTEALRRTIRTEAMLRKQIEEGFRIVLVSEDGKTQREVLRW